MIQTIDIYNDPIMDRIARSFFDRYPRAKCSTPAIPGFSCLIIIVMEVDRMTEQIHTYCFRIYRDNVAIHADANFVGYNKSWYLSDPNFSINMVLQGFLDAFAHITNYEIATISYDVK